MRAKLRSLPIALLICLVTFPASAYDLYFSNAHPYMAHTKKNQGFLVDLVVKAGSDIGVPITPTFVPWKRAQLITAKNRNNLIIAVRSPKREEKYTWITPLFDMQTVIATANQKINTIEQAEELLEMLVIMPGIALENRLISEGFPRERLTSFTINEDLVKFLSVRPNTGWIAQKMQITSFWSRSAAKNPIVLGDVIEKRTLWLACSRDCSGIPLKKLKGSVQSIQESPWYERRKAFYIKPLKTN